MSTARDDILGKVRATLGRTAPSSAPPLPPNVSATVPTRLAGDSDADVDAVLSELAKVGATPQRIRRPEDLHAALGALVVSEAVKKAVLWDTDEIRALGIADTLAGLGVEIVPTTADKWALADCDLGVTGVDLALPETGTLVLRSSAEKPRAVSLLPRVHLALLRPSARRPDLRQVFEELDGERYFVFVTGPSRTADIELTLTIGVHGPGALYVWALEESV
ncbi:MAG: LUD domain-containing protein [Anaerolineae bacterium]